MSEVKYLTLDDVVAVIQHLKVGPIRDLGLLDSAVNRPRASAFGEDAYQSVEVKAGALLHSMTKNRALVDGNKRTAWLSTMMFCDLNGFDSSLSDDGAIQLLRDVASSVIDDVQTIVDRLQLEPRRS
jgi:death-on-curing protein